MSGWGLALPRARTDPALPTLGLCSRPLERLPEPLPLGGSKALPGAVRAPSSTHVRRAPLPGQRRPRLRDPGLHPTLATRQTEGRERSQAPSLLPPRPCGPGWGPVPTSGSPHPYWMGRQDAFTGHAAVLRLVTCLELGRQKGPWLEEAVRARWAGVQAEGSRPGAGEPERVEVAAALSCPAAGEEGGPLRGHGLPAAHPRRLSPRGPAAAARPLPRPGPERPGSQAERRRQRGPHQGGHRLPLSGHLCCR